MCVGYKRRPGERERETEAKRSHNEEIKVLTQTGGAGIKSRAGGYILEKNKTPLVLR